MSAEKKIAQKSLFSLLPLNESACGLHKLIRKIFFQHSSFVRAAGKREEVKKGRSF